MQEDAIKHLIYVVEKWMHKSSKKKTHTRQGVVVKVF